MDFCFMQGGRLTILPPLGGSHSLAPYPSVLRRDIGADLFQVVLAVIIALIVSGYLKRRKKKEQAGEEQSARLSPADERKLSARPEPGGPILTDLELDEMEQLTEEQ